MMNAIKYDQRITVGGVPSGEDLVQLRELGYRTLVDVRSEDERFGGFVERRARALGMEYIGIPITRREITNSDLEAFYDAVFGRGTAPLFVFSRRGKRPLAFLVLFEVAARGEPAVRIFQRAARYGFNLDGDLHLQAFLVNLLNTGSMEPLLVSVLKHRPDLLRK